MKMKIFRWLGLNVPEWGYYWLGPLRVEFTMENLWYLLLRRRNGCYRVSEVGAWYARMRLMQKARFWLAFIMGSQITISTTWSKFGRMNLEAGDLASYNEVKESGFSHTKRVRMNRL